MLEVDVKYLGSHKHWKKGLVMKSLTCGLWIVVALASVASQALAASFTDDFTTWNAAYWTHHGGDNVSVDHVVADAVYVDAARNWEPASRITHAMSTGNDDFKAQFDIRYTGGNNGIFQIGWANVDDFAYVQRHSDFSTITSWSDHSYVGLNFGYYGRTSLNGSEDGNGFSGGQFADMPLNVWHTVSFERVGDQIMATSMVRDTGAAAGSVTMTTPNDLRSYNYFHISTWDNLMNSRHTYFEVDNVVLNVGPAVPGPVAGLAIVALFGLNCSRRCIAI